MEKNSCIDDKRKAVNFREATVNSIRQKFGKGRKNRGHVVISSSPFPVNRTFVLSIDSSNLKGEFV